MKNTALILIALLTVSIGAYAQDGKKQEPEKKLEGKKPVRKVTKEVKTPAPKKTEAPAKKLN